MKVSASVAPIKRKRNLTLKIFLNSLLFVFRLNQSFDGRHLTNLLSAQDPKIRLVETSDIVATSGTSPRYSLPIIPSPIAKVSKMPDKVPNTLQWTKIHRSPKDKRKECKGIANRSNRTVPNSSVIINRMVRNLHAIHMHRQGYRASKTKAIWQKGKKRIASFLRKALRPEFKSLISARAIQRAYLNSAHFAGRLTKGICTLFPVLA